MMDHFQRSERIILHNADRDSAFRLHMSMTRSAEDCADVLIDVHITGLYSPRQPSRIVKCTPKKLVITGDMVFGELEPFKLTFRLNKKAKKNPTIWWNASLDLYAHTHFDLLIPHENNYEPDQIISPVTYRDERIQKGASILHQRSIHDHTFPYDIGTFAGWHPKSRYYISYRRSPSEPREYVHIRECFAIFNAPTPSTPHPNAITIPTPPSYKLLNSYYGGDTYGNDP